MYCLHWSPNLERFVVITIKIVVYHVVCGHKTETDIINSGTCTVFVTCVGC